MNTEKQELFKKYIYWLNKAELDVVVPDIIRSGKKIGTALKTPCEVLKAKGNKVMLATPGVFSRVCTRQGSWYRASDKAGKYMLVSEERLAPAYDKYLDVQISESGFQPESLPTSKQIDALVNSEAYRSQRPDGWEDIGVKDSVLFKTLFTLTGFWGWGDNLGKHWANHRANHANFLAKEYTTEIDGEDVPYSVTNNDGVCSSCVEFFNIIEQDTRKLVRACPGSITFAGVKPEVYYDVKSVPVTFHT